MFKVLNMEPLNEFESEVKVERHLFSILKTEKGSITFLGPGATVYLLVPKRVCDALAERGIVLDRNKRFHISCSIVDSGGEIKLLYSIREVKP